MKKFFVFVIVILIALLISVNANICLANYHDDSDYVFVTMAQGDIYLNLKSIDVQEYNPPHYQIAGTFVYVCPYFDENDNILFKESRFILVKRYNWYTKETFSRDYEDKNKWIKDKIDEKKSGLAAIRNRSFADSMFKAAYGVDFYGY